MNTPRHLPRSTAPALLMHCALGQYVSTDPVLQGSSLATRMLQPGDVQARSGSPPVLRVQAQEGLEVGALPGLCVPAAPVACSCHNNIFYQISDLPLMAVPSYGVCSCARQCQEDTLQPHMASLAHADHPAWAAADYVHGSHEAGKAQRSPATPCAVAAR